MKYLFKSRMLLIRICIFLLFITAIIMLYKILASGGNNFLGRVTIGEFFLKSRIILVIVFALAGGLLFYLIRMRYWFRVAIMVLSFFIFGIYPAMVRVHCFFNLSSPLCSLMKPLLFISQGSYNIPIKFFVLFVIIMALSLLGKNIFCGWVCPVGAMQEIVHFSTSKIGKKRVQFKKSMAVRTMVFVVSITLLFTAGINLYYEYLNPFIALSLRFSTDILFLMSLFVFVIAGLASVFLYRPYCSFICPIGLITWATGLLSVFRVRCDMSKCTKCMSCVEGNSCAAIEYIINDKKPVPDCFCCGRCIDSCPEGALRFTAR